MCFNACMSSIFLTLNVCIPTASAGISTGLFTESQAYFGVFQDVRANAVGNLNTTLDGQVSRRVDSVNIRA